MFTRYNSSINIPNNYGGSRFRVPPETETKTHRETGAKTSVSPSFSAVKQDSDINDNFDNAKDTFEEEKQEFIDTYATESEFYDEAPEVDDLSDERESSDDNDEKQRQLGQIKESFSRLFSSIEKDDLLLVALIILIASSNDGIDFGTTLLLALLLIYH